MPLQVQKSHIRKHSVAPMPASMDPMLATSGELPREQGEFTFEYKWDGVRALAFFGKSDHRIYARSGNDITKRYPELNTLAEALSGRQVIVDGEIVSLGDDGRPSFGKLQNRMHLNDAKEIARLSKSEPVFYVLFDILYAEGRSLIDEPYTRRRELLEELTFAGASWQLTPAHVGEGTAMLASARQNQLEGIVAKKLNSVYRPGQRSADWIKIKIIQRQEFVVAGWVPERTGTAGRIGSLLLGYYDCEKHLRYAGKVGTGLSAGDHEPLVKKLSQGACSKSPFVDEVPTGALFTAKPLVGEVEYRRWPHDGLLQQAAFKGLRTDKNPKAVVRESIS